MAGHERERIKNLASAATAQFLIFTTALFLVVAAVGQQAGPGNSVTSNTQNANTGNGVSGIPNCNCVDLLVSYQNSTSSNNPYGFAVGGTNYGKYSIGWTNVAANPSSAVRSLGSYCQTTTYDPQTGIFSTNLQSSGYFTSIYGTIYTQSNSPTSYSTYSGYSFSTNTPLYSTSTNYQTITTTNTLVTNDCAGDTTNVTTSMTNNSSSPSPGSVMQITPLPIPTGYGPGSGAYMNSVGGWTYSDPLPPPPTNTVAQARAQANASLGPWGPYTYTPSNTGTGSYTTGTAGVSITNGKYYWHAHGTQPVTVNWFLLYTSQDGSTTSIIKTNSWTSTGPGDSPKYSDLTVPPSRGAGTVTLLPADIEPDAGQSGTTGDLVPSIKGTGGQKHYVSPKLASSFVVLKAIVPPSVDSNFSTYFEWDTINPDGTSNSAGQAVSGSPDKWEVKRDTPGQYIVRLKTIADHKEVLRINVWIVWASGAITASPLPTASLSHISGFTTIDGTVSAGAFASLNNYYTFKFTIQPATITDKTQDVPNLTGPKDPTGDSQLGGQSPYSTNPLSGGAIDRWDVSRRVEYHFLNPNLIPYGKMTAGYGSIYQGEPQAGLITIPFPSSNIIGNDDSSVGDEDNDPYDASTDSLLGHSIGSITSLDKPNSGLADAGGASGYSFEEDDLFQEFARLEINTTWYVVSDPVPWKLIMKLNYTGGQWTDNGTTTGTGN